MFDASEKELAWLFQQRDAQLGLSGAGLEPGTPSPWDEQRSTRAHGFNAELGRLVLTASGLTSARHRQAVLMEGRVVPTFFALPSEHRTNIAAAFDTAGATSSVIAALSGDWLAPLVGLALVTPAALEVREKQKRESARSLLELFDQILRNGSKRSLGVVKSQAAVMYRASLEAYDALRVARIKRARDARAAEMSVYWNGGGR